jgi:hypothetical protein
MAAQRKWYEVVKLVFDGIASGKPGARQHQFLESLRI